MTGQHQPPMEVGSVIDYQDFRSACREIHRRRHEQASLKATAEAHYQHLKAQAIIRLKADGASSTEATARVKGEDDVGEAMIKRDLEAEKLELIREDGWNLRKLADWSMQVSDPSYGAPVVKVP